MTYNTANGTLTDTAPIPLYTLSLFSPSSASPVTLEYNVTATTGTVPEPASIALVLLETAVAILKRPVKTSIVQ